MELTTLEHGNRNYLVGNGVIADSGSGQDCSFNRRFILDGDKEGLLFMASCLGKASDNAG